MPKMPTDREKCGLRGPVCLVVTRQIAESGESAREETFDRDEHMVSVRERRVDGSQWSVEYRYDADGQRYDADGRRVGLHIRTVRGPDGNRVEAADISAVNGWAMEGMNGVGFGTRGASVAETTFDSRGHPLGAVLRDDRGGEVFRISCTCDADGRIVEAAQYGGAALPPLPGVSEWDIAEVPADQRELTRAFLEPGFEQFRFAFRYDSAGRVVERTGSVAGREKEHTVNAYNDRGDLQTATAKTETGTMVYEFDYAYDERGNWIRKTARYFAGSSVAGSDEYSRTINYFD